MKTETTTYLEKRDPQLNMARFYALSLEPCLFGGICVSRRWGRIGARVSQHKIELLADEQQARARLQDLMLSKVRRGYREPLR